MSDARAWPAAFVEFLYGDAVPNIKRDRDIFFEEWAAGIVERAGHKHERMHRQL